MSSKALKYPKTVYIYWSNGIGDKDDYLTFSETPEEVNDFTECESTDVAIYELKTLATVETRTETTVTPQR